MKDNIYLNIQISGYNPQTKKHVLLNSCPKQIKQLGKVKLYHLEKLPILINQKKDLLKFLELNPDGVSEPELMSNDISIAPFNLMSQWLEELSSEQKIILDSNKWRIRE